MKSYSSLLIQVTAICVATAGSVSAQKAETHLETNGITIIQDKRIPPLVQTYVATVPDGIPGFRIQIFFTAKKAIALEVKTSFTEKFPDYQGIVEYDQPYFKVLAGAFRTKLQAEKLLKLIKEEFPGSFVVSSNIPVKDMELATSSKHSQ